MRPLCSVTAGHRTTARQSGASGADGAHTLDGDLAPPSRGGGDTSNYFHYILNLLCTIHINYIDLTLSIIHANCAKLVLKNPSL